MAARIPGVQVPPGATVEVSIRVSATVNITAFVARQKVTGFGIQEVSSQLRAEPPDLLVGDRLCWSVPVVYTSPERDVVGKVGEVLVDATTGELLADDEAVRRMTEDALLAERPALQAGA